MKKNSIKKTRNYKKSKKNNRKYKKRKQKAGNLLKYYNNNVNLPAHASYSTYGLKMDDLMHNIQKGGSNCGNCNIWSKNATYVNGYSPMTRIDASKYDYPAIWNQEGGIKKKNKSRRKKYKSRRVKKNYKGGSNCSHFNGNMSTRKFGCRQSNWDVKCI